MKTNEILVEEISERDEEALKYLKDIKWCRYQENYLTLAQDKALDLLEKQGLTQTQDALDVYLKLPHKHYNTGWVLSQHLKEDMKLSYLAQELVSTDRLAPQSWFAMGNCYSLQKDHETALEKSEI